MAVGRHCDLSESNIAELFSGGAPINRYAAAQTPLSIPSQRRLNVAPFASRAVRESRDSAGRKAGRNTTAEVIQIAG